MQGREPVGRVCRRPPAVLGQPLAQPVDVAECRRLERVEVWVRREERIGRLAVEPIAPTA